MATKAKKVVKKKVTAITKKNKPTKSSKMPAKKSVGAVKKMKVVAGKKKPAVKAKPVAKKAVSKKVVSKPKAKMKVVVKKKVQPPKKKIEIKKVVAKKPIKVVAKPVKTVKVKVSSTKSIIKKFPNLAKKTKMHSAFIPRILPVIDVNVEVPPYQETAGEEYMNEKQRKHFHYILLQRKQQILEEMGRTVHHLQDEAANFPDPNDRATQEEEFSLELRTRDRERKFIKNIEDALQKLDEGEYGYCDACGIEIGIRRLEARPTANLCIDCKTLDEIRERQMGG